MSNADTIASAFPDLYITAELDRRPAVAVDHRQEMLAVQELAARMADGPEDILPRFVELAMEIAGGASAGISLYESESTPGVFRWCYLRGELSTFDGATTPRDFSPCGVTLDQQRPVLSRHPERAYDWIADAQIVVPEVLLTPLYFSGAEPMGTLWIVANEGQFTRSHASAMTELATFVSIALRMRETERRLQQALSEQELLAREMGHRVKNLFAVTDGMIRSTARTASSTAEFASALSGRLHALAAAHALVSRKLRDVSRPPRTSDLATLLAAVVLPHISGGNGAAPRIVMEGPPMGCGDHAINSIALVVHELATNAVKYGALSNEAGAVEIAWRQDGDDWRFTWVEQGGPPVAAAPSGNGFGASLVRNTVVRQLRGELSPEWRPEGLKVTIRVPLKELAG